MTESCTAPGFRIDYHAPDPSAWESLMRRSLNPILCHHPYTPMCKRCRQSKRGTPKDSE